jgi:transcription elongation factor Elf1
MKCPVCGKECETTQDFMENYMLEDISRCPEGHYAYEYVTGSTHTIIGPVEVYRHYTDSYEERKLINQIEKLAIELAKINGNYCNKLSTEL